MASVAELKRFAHHDDDDDDDDDDSSDDDDYTYRCVNLVPV